jgi:pimeloyl-ACP methyl ester carboxylesterase
MKRRLLVLALTAAALGGARPASAQFACLVSSNAGALLSNPRNFCPLVLYTPTGEIRIGAALAAFAFYSRVTISGEVTGDMGRVLENEPGLPPAATSFSCQPIDEAPLGRASTPLSYSTRYSPGVHRITLTFRYCDGSVHSSVSVVIVADSPGTTPTERCTPGLIDPARFLLLRGTSVTTDTALLARSPALPESGVAADGVARLVVRIPARQAGESISVDVRNDGDERSTSVEEDGGLSSLDDQGTRSSLVNLVAQDTGQGPMAFAIFHAPLDFSRGPQDERLLERHVSLRVTCRANGDSTGLTEVRIGRPPVVLVHGIWSSGANAWTEFSPTEAPARALWEGLHPSKVDYSDPVNVISSVPSYPVFVVKPKSSSLGFSVNAPKVLKQIEDGIASYRLRTRLVAEQADVVSHSMGGDLSRYTAVLPAFFTDRTGWRGPIHKLITIDTPHRGTEIADQLFDPLNDCLRTLQGVAGNYSFETVVANGTTSTGALADMRGDGGTPGSVALQLLPVMPPFPIAYVVGSTDANTRPAARCGRCLVIELLCRDSPLAGALYLGRWDEFVFRGQPNDGLVTTDSQSNLAGNEIAVAGTHSASLNHLGFTGPSVLQGTSGVPGFVVGLLNEKVSGPHFQH